MHGRNNFILNYMCTAAQIFIEGRMKPCGRSLCTPEARNANRAL